MGIVDQIKEVLRLLEETKDDFNEWLEVMNEENFGNKNSIRESKKLIKEVESLLHEIGA